MREALPLRGMAASPVCTVDPGERVVRADEAGLLIDLVEAVDRLGRQPADIAVLEAAKRELPWAAETIHALTNSSSLREAAGLLYIHHSTLHDRIARLEQVLGWPLSTPQGRARAYLALNLARAARGRAQA